MNNTMDTDYDRLIDEKDAKIEHLSKELLMQREEILAQKEVIENQRDLAIRQRDEIDHQKREITSSITYARKIQHALLSSKAGFKYHFADHFILYRPKDIVSGDFYWMQEKKNRIVVAAADSTGHGVPGAFMSLMGIVFLNELVDAQEILQPNRILNLMEEKIIDSLGQSDKTDIPSDGMDMALITIDREKELLQYAGAYHSAYLIREGELIRLRPDRKSLGYRPYPDHAPYTNHEMEILPNDRIYLFSDGYIDQFGWKNNKKFMSRNFRQLLLDIQHVPMKAQKRLLENHLDNWMGELEQLDDIMVIGLQL